MAEVEQRVGGPIFVVERCRARASTTSRRWHRAHDDAVRQPREIGNHRAMPGDADRQ